jgi:hypothetical protein
MYCHVTEMAAIARLRNSKQLMTSLNRDNGEIVRSGVSYAVGAEAI